MDQRPEITALADDFELSSPTPKERKNAPLKKLLKFHVLPFDTTVQVNQWKTDTKGQPNPDYGKEQPILIFKAELDESDAKGQWYSAWLTGYYDKVSGKPVYPNGPKSKLAKIAEALVDGVANLPKNPNDMAGTMFQCALKPNKDGTRQVLDLDKIMPAAEGQTIPTDASSADVVLTDIPDAPISDEELEAAFSGK